CVRPLSGYLDRRVRRWALADASGRKLEVPGGHDAGLHDLALWISGARDRAEARCRLVDLRESHQEPLRTGRASDQDQEQPRREPGGLPVTAAALGAGDSRDVDAAVGRAERDLAPGGAVR